MKSRMWTTFCFFISTVTLTLPTPSFAQENETNQPHYHHYKLIDTGTLGGATSSLGFEGERDVNNQGTVLSLAETTIPDPTCFFPDCYVGHTVQWRDGVLNDLGALPTVNNSGPIWINDLGLATRGWIQKPRGQVALRSAWQAE